MLNPLEIIGATLFFSIGPIVLILSIAHKIDKIRRDK